MTKPADQQSQAANWSLQPSLPAPRPAPRKRPNATTYDLWNDDAAMAAAPEAAAVSAAAAHTASKRAKPPRSRSALPPAVEVCDPGASYNPPRAPHQALLGAAVAVEHMKELKKELEPVHAPLIGKAAAAMLEQVPSAFSLTNYLYSSI